MTLARGAAAAADQPAQTSIPAAVNGDGNQLQAAFEAEFSSHEELYFQELRRHVCPYDAGDGTFIRDGDRAVTELMGAFDQFLGMRSAAQESKVAETVQLSVRRYDRDRRTDHPNTPCRNQRCGSARSRNIHSCTP